MKKKKMKTVGIEHRTEVLFARVTKTNKKRVTMYATKLSKDKRQGKVSEAKAVDLILSRFFSQARTAQKAARA